MIFSIKDIVGLKAIKALIRMVLNPHKSEALRELPVVLELSKYTLKSKSCSNPVIVGYGFEFAKRILLRRLFPRRTFVFLPEWANPRDLHKFVHLLEKFEPWVWSYRDRRLGYDENGGFWGGGLVTRVEDGFIRSIGLGSEGADPYSFCFDKVGLYFDGTAPSQLERLCNDADFSKLENQLQSAPELIKRLRLSGITKYNFRKTCDSVSLPSEPNKQTILVLGQVEDDLSILSNASRIRTNEALVKQAIDDHPEAIVLYKPHPDVYWKKRKQLSDPDQHLPHFHRIAPTITLQEALQQADIVYTISSLAGFEALLYGKQVKTYGAPFYAGWGLTMDDMFFERRKRELSLTQLFVLSYLVYPLYFDPKTGEELDFEEVVTRLEKAVERLE